MLKNKRSMLITSAGAALLFACGEAPVNEVVTELGALTVIGAQYADGRIETTLLDERDDERLETLFQGGDKVSVTVIENGTRFDDAIDARALGTELESWNRYAYELWASMPESGMAETHDGIGTRASRGLPSRLPGGGGSSGGSNTGGSTGGGGAEPGTHAECQGTNCTGKNEMDVESAYECPAGKTARCTFVNSGADPLDDNDDTYSCTCIGP